MTQQARIEREIVFKGNASHTGNIRGRPSFQNQIVHYDDFVGKAIDNTNDYTVAAVNSGTAIITVPHMLTLASDTDDDDDIDVAMGIEWYGQYNAAMEVRFRIDDVDMTAINIGFSDATGESTDLIAMMYSGVTLTSTATDFVGFLHDADASTDKLYAVSVNGATDGAVIDSGITTDSDSILMTVRVELIDTGSTTNAAFYANNTGREIDPQVDFIGSELAAVGRTTALCPYIALINHGESAANTMDVDYIKVWQDRI